MEVVHTATAAAAATASDAPKDRRDDTTEEYPIAEDGHDDGNHSENDVSHPPSGCDENQEGGAKQGASESRKQNGVRRKKRKRKRREQPIPLPVVGPGEVLVPIHTVWSRGKRMKGGHVVKRDDTVERYIDSKGTVYNCDDTIYLDAKEPDQPFFVCSIASFTLKKRDTLSLNVKWFFRASELPFSVRDHLLQDRNTEHGAGDIIKDPEIKARELFISKANATDTFPISQLRGKCQVIHYQDIGSARAFKPSPDVFFYVLGYNPHTKRLATTQGEIRVGSSHQALLPQCKPNLSPSQMPEECHDYEDIQWRPYRVADSDLLMYLRAARSMCVSIAAFAGMCDGAENDMEAASADDTTMNAIDILHKHNYDTSKALQALVKCPAMKTIEKKWSEEDSKRFVRGLKQHGKNFYLIRKTLLPCRETGELIEYYYFWKKTQNALSNRGQVKKLKKSKKTTRSSQPDVEFLDHSSVSECSDDSEDSDGGRDLSNYTCQHCFTNISRDWHHAGKDRSLLCTECRLFFKKYGEDRPLDGDKDTSSYLFKPVKEEEDTVNGKHNMRTRRGNSASKPDSKSRKRRAADLEGKVKKNRSDSESMLDSSDNSGNEDLGNEADSDDNNQDDLSASSQPSTPSSLDTEFKSAKDYIKPEPLTQSPLVGLSHPHAHPATAATTATISTTTTTSSCSATPVVTPVPASQDANPVGFGVGGRFPLGLSNPSLPVGATFGDVKPPLGLYPHPHPHPLAGSLASLPPRLPLEATAVSIPSSETGVVPAGGLPVSSLVSQPPSTLTTTSSVLTSSSSSSSSSSLTAAAASTSGSSSTMTSMSSTGVTLMSSGSGASGEGEREKKYTPPQPQPLPGMGGSLFSPYTHPYYPYAAHLGPRLAGPPPPVPSLVPIKKEPGEAVRGEAGDVVSKDSSVESHTVHRPLPQSLSSSSSSSSSSSQSSSSEQKLAQPPHMSVPPPLTSIDSSSMPGGLVDRSTLVGPDSLRDNSREAILRESREIPLLGGSSASSSIPTDLPTRALFPPPLTSLTPSATVTSTSLPPSLTGNIPHHLPLAVPPMAQGDRARLEGHAPGADPGRQDIGIGIPPSLRPGIKVEDGGIVEEVVDDSDSDREGSTTPGPSPTPCNKEVYHSKSALFIKVLDRGERNCCSRCDLIFRPLPSSSLAKKREERARKPTSSSTASSSSTSTHQSMRDDKPRERRPDTPPKSVSVDSQGPSSSLTSSQHTLYPERHTPRPYQDTPALRQLSEYARPHAMGQDPQRAYLGLGGPPHMDPLAGYRHLAMYPPGSRERLELELERDKRERDARERELRERELREMELREKMKADMDLKPPGLERLLPPGANSIDPHWLEMQRRFAYPPTGLAVLPHGGGGANHLPGVYPPVSLAGELAAREREKLERLGIPAGHHPPLAVDLSYARVVESISAERQQAERLALVQPSNPEALARLQMANLANNQAAAVAAAAMHAHTHAHTHSHTHLHLHQQQENNLAAAAAALAGSGGGSLPGPLHPMAHHLYPHMPPPPAGADPMAGLPSGSGTPTSLASLHPGSQPPLLHGASSREQAELLQRELYSRAYMDPTLAHQLSAQAHQEAIHRQLALERERFGPASHLPH